MKLDPHDDHDYHPMYTYGHWDNNQSMYVCYVV